MDTCDTCDKWMLSLFFPGKKIRETLKKLANINFFQAGTFEVLVNQPVQKRVTGSAVFTVQTVSESFTQLLILWQISHQVPFFSSEMIML